jgi:hypothetical protein
MIRLIGTALVGSLSLAFAFGVQTPSPQPPKAPAGLDVAAIDRAMGKSGTIIGDVYKIALPRTDLSVTVGGVKVRSRPSATARPARSCTATSSCSIPS